MHSHITGVLPGLQSHGLGRVLKQHQRDWAFARDVGHITWTFDPLVARNAHFNLRVLGARVTEYLVDHYGPMDDGVNRGDETDRVMVSWALAAPPAPTPPDEQVVASVEVPHDIETMRREAPADAAAWRVRVREQFLGPAGGGPGRRRVRRRARVPVRSAVSDAARRVLRRRFAVPERCPRPRNPSSRRADPPPRGPTAAPPRLRRRIAPIVF